MWAPAKCGLIQVFAADSGDWLTYIRGHEAAIRSICTAGQRYVLTGGESKDGHIKVSERERERETEREREREREPERERERERHRDRDRVRERERTV